MADGGGIQPMDLGRVHIALHGLDPQASYDALSRDALQYAHAVGLVVQTNRPNTSFLQRRLQIGYNMAAALIERMEREGIVGPADRAGSRAVLDTPLVAELRAQVGAGPASPSLSVSPGLVPGVHPAASDPHAPVETSRHGPPEQVRGRRVESGGRHDEGVGDGDMPNAIIAAARSRLKSFVERLERLEEDRAAVLADLKEVYAEAKGEGFDVKILRKVIRLRAQDKAKRDEEEALIDLYLAAIGEAA